MRLQLARPALLGLILLAAAGVMPRPVARAEGPDQLLFTAKRTDKQDLYLIDPDGSDEKNLTKDGAGNAMGVWSPDGKKIAFVSKRSGNAELYLMDADGNNVQRLTDTPDEENQPAWSPDGKKLAFCRSSGNAVPTYEIFVMDAAGGNAVILSNSEGFDGDPAWSPDGKQILFLSVRGGDGFRLYLMNADGTDPHLLPVKETGDPWVFPAWSPDGKRFAYTDRVNDAAEIFTCNADGTDRKKVTASGGINTIPAWSPDGKQLAFIHYDQPGGDGTLWITSTDGQSQSRLAPTAGFLEGRPAWKPG